jgi:pyruvate,water dikinase
MTPPLVQPLREALDERQVGGKARNLARLAALGAPVPDGLVLTRTARDAWLGPVGSVVPQAPSARGALPVQLRDALASVVRELRPGDAVAVRSSAVGEDGVYASFAGQLDTILGVTTIEDLERAVLACWASLGSERVRAYQAARGTTLEGMGVIVQRQVNARVSGVLFTRDPGPTSEPADDLLIEYCEGLGDALVSGRIDPGRLRVSRRDLSVRQLAAPSGGAVGSSPTDALTPRRILDLARLALRLECELGGPQDVEWAIDEDGGLWILQARPITTLHNRGPGERVDVLWSNANVNENFPRPISPLLYSIAAPGYSSYFRNLGAAFGVSRRRLAAMDRPLDAIIGVHGARMYYNLTSIHAVLRMAPFGEALASAFNEFVGASEMAAQPPEAVRWRDRGGRIAQVLEVAWMAACTTWQYLFLGRRIREFERIADAFAARTHPDALPERSEGALLGDLDAFIGIRTSRWKNASLADAASMVCYALLQRGLRRAGGGPGLQTRLLRALSGVPSSVPPIRLWALSRRIRADQALRDLFTRPSSEVLDALAHDDRHASFRQALEAYLEEWGFRSSEELMLTAPSLQEDPRPVVELLKGYLSMDGESPEEAIARQAAERVQETSRLLRRLTLRAPGTAVLVWVLLRWTQRAVAYRERARLKQALLYSRCRRLALAIGDRFVRAGWLRKREEIFMLTWQEVVELGSGRAMFPDGVADLVSLRSREHERLAATQPPDTIRLQTGRYLRREVAVPDADMGPGEAGSDRHANTLTGASACGGVVTARAAVLADIAESSRLERGDVLVTRQTDPGWAPVFCLISGLVIERGGMLSHGAILAREFGLPCIVGIRNATIAIPHGSIVTVDGDHGTCVVADGDRPRQEAPLSAGGRAS